MKKKKANEKTNFELFVNECKRWVDYFGLNGWDIRYVHDGETDITDAIRATTLMGAWDIDVPSRTAIISLTKNPPDWLNDDDELKLIAFHEVVEGILLGRLLTLAHHRYTTRPEIEEAGHEIVAILENTAYKDISKLRHRKEKSNGQKTKKKNN